MSGKTKDFSALARGLADVLPGGGKPPAPAAATPLTAAEPAPPPAKKGRPQVDTMPLTVRVPRTLNQALVDAAAEASKAEGKTVTVQQMILRVLEQRYG